MAKMVKQSQTAQPLVFMLVLASDHISPATGKTPTVTISKNGGSFASPSGAVAEIGSGWYSIAGNATDTGTLGPLIIHVTEAASDPTDERYEVVAFDPQDATALGLSRIDATISSRSTLGGTAQTGDNFARLGAPAGASLSADVAAVLAKSPDSAHYTNARGDNLANLDAAISSRSTLGGTAQTGDAYARLGAPAGLSVSADIAGVLSKTPDAVHFTNARGDLLDHLNADITSRLASGNVTVGGYAAGEDPATLLLVTPANKLSTDASGNVTVGTLVAAAIQSIWDRLTSALTTVGSIGKLLVDNINATISSRSTYAGADTAGTTTLLGRLTSGRATNLDNLDATVSSRNSGNVTVGGYAAGEDPATLVLDVAQSGHNTAGTIGNKIGAAGSSGDPWGTALPGSYAAGTAGAILGSAAAISGLGSGGNTILLDYGVPSLTLYAVFRDYVSKHYWNGTTLEAFALANYTNYDVAAAEEGGSGNSGLYVITAPALPAGVYDVAVRRQAGGSPAATDQPAFDTTIIWDGSQIVLAVGGGGTGGGGTDPWLTALPGAYAAGTAGNIVGSNLDAAVSSRSTYAGGDTAGTTTLLGRLTSGRAVLLDNLDAAITTRLAAASYVAPDNADIATLVGRLTSARAALLDNLSNLDAAISSRLATAGYTAPPTVAAIDAQLTGTHGSGAWNIAGSGGGSDPATIAAAVWAAASRTLTAGGVDPAAIAGSVWAAANRSLTADPTNPAALATAVWGAASRTLTGSGINAAAIAAAVWSNAVRTLTSQQDLVGTLPAANQITVVRGDTLDVSVPLLGDLTNRTMLTLTAKLDIDDPDSAALFQVVEGVGLTILNGAAAVTPAQATLTVATPASGIAVLHVDSAATALFGPDFAYVFDVQVEYIGEVRTPIIGPMVVIGDVTRAA